LSKETGDGSFLGVDAEGELLCVARTEGTGSVIVSERQEWQRQFHCTAAGKILLAFGKPESLDQLERSGDLPRLTSETIIRADRLRADIEATREKGYSLCRDESATDVAAIGVPILGRDRVALAALSQSFPSFYLETGRISAPERAQVLRRFAGSIGANISSMGMGGRGSCRAVPNGTQPK